MRYKPERAGTASCTDDQGDTAPKSFRATAASACVSERGWQQAKFSLVNPQEEALQGLQREGQHLQEFLRARRRQPVFYGSQLVSMELEVWPLTAA